MTRLIGRALPALALVFAAAIGLVRARPADDSAIKAIVTPSDGCPIPCWQGIRFGVTSLESAWAILRDHPWMDDIRLAQRIDALVWRWTGAQPAAMRPDVRGVLALRADNTVDGVMLHTVIPFGALLLALGEPDHLYSLPNQQVIAVYDRAFLEVVTRAACPPNVSRLWTAETELRIRTTRVGYAVFDARPIDLGRADWVRSVYRCGD